MTGQERSLPYRVSRGPVDERNIRYIETSEGDPVLETDAAFAYWVCEAMNEKTEREDADPCHCGGIPCDH